MIIRKITPMKGQYIPPTASRQAPPVHEATGGHAVRGNYCIHNHVGVILRIIAKIIKIMDYKWYEEMNCAVTVCDNDGNIIFMNRKSRDTFAEGTDRLVGSNLRACHSDRSWDTIQRLLKTGGTNSYTIHKKGVKKMIYQTAWFENGKVMGLVEISMVIPEEMPHYER